MADISIPEGDNPVRYQASLGGNQKYRNMGNISGQAYLVRGQVTNVYYQKGTLDFNTYGSSITSGTTDGSGSAPIPVDFWGKNTDGKVFGCYRPVQKGSQILVAYIGGDTSRPIVVGVYPDNESSYELISPVHYNTGDDSTDDVQNDALGERKIYPNQQMMYESGKGDILRSMGGKSFLYISENGSGYLDDINYAYDEISDFYDADANEIEPTMTKAQSWLLVHEDNDSDEAADGHRTRFYVNRSGELMVTFANKEDPNEIVVLEASKDSGFKLTKRFDNSNLKEDSEDYVQFGIGNGNNVSIKSVDSGDATSFYLDNGNIKFETPKEGSITFDGTSVNDLLGKISDVESAANDASDKADVATKAGEIAKSAASDAASQALAASYAGEDAKSAAVNAQAAGEDAKAQAKDTQDRIIYYASISSEKDVAVPGKYIIVNTDTYIANGTIKTAHIGDGAITNAKIANLAVGNAQLEDAAITRAKIGNLAVGTAQIEDLAITDAKVGDLSANHLKAGTIDFSVISGIHINASEIDVGKIVADQIYVTGLGDISKNLGTVTSGKITGTNINDDVDNVQSGVNDLNDPNIMNVIEKQAVSSQYAGLTSQYNVILDRAKDDGISTADLTTAYNNLNNFITPLLKDTTKASNIDRYTYNSLTYYYNTALSNVQAALKDAYNTDISNMQSSVAVASQAASSAVIVASQAATTGDNASYVAAQASAAASQAQIAGDNATSVANNATSIANTARSAADSTYAYANSEIAVQSTATANAQSTADNAFSQAQAVGSQASAEISSNSTATAKAQSTADNAFSQAQSVGSQASSEIAVNSMATAKAQSTADNAFSQAQAVGSQTSSEIAVNSMATAKAQSTADNAFSQAQAVGSQVSAEINSNSTATAKAQSTADTAFSQATTAIDNGQATSQAVTALKDGSTMTIAELQNGLATKVANSEYASYKDQTASQIGEMVTNGAFSAYKQTTADLISSKVATSDFSSYKDQTATAIDSKVESKDFNTYKTQTADLIDAKVSSSEYASDKTQTASQIANMVSNSAFSTYQNQTASQIASKVDNGDFSTYKTQTADLIAQKVANSDFSAYQATTAKSIESKVESSDFNTYKQQTDKAITSKVESSDFQTLQTQVDNSAVGANLIVQSTLASGYIDRDKGSIDGSGGDFHTDYIPVSGITTVTISSPDYTFTYSGNHTLAMYDTDKKFLGWQNLYPTTTFSKENVAFIMISICFTDQGGTSGNLSDWLASHRYKLEKGSVATDWCLNPEDQATQSQITQLSGEIEQKVSNSEYASYKDQTASEISDRVSNSAFSTYQTQTADLISSKVATKDFTAYQATTADAIDSKVESKDFNTYKTQTADLIDDKVSSSAYASDKTQTASQIANMVSNSAFSTYQNQTASQIAQMVTNGAFSAYQQTTADLISSKVANSDFSAYQATTAKAIESKVESSDFNTYKTQTADAISSKVSSTDFNNLKVGSRNLYLNSKELKDGYGTNQGPTVTVEPFDSTTNMWHIVSGQGTGDRVGIYLYRYADDKLPDTSDWSFSADVKGTGKTTWFGVEAGDHNQVIGTVGSEWSRISQTGRFDNPGVKTIVIYFDTTNSPLDVYIKLPKLESGNMPTDWTPAPEDQATQSQITQLSGEIDQKVSNSEYASDKTQTASQISQMVTNGAFSAYSQATAELISDKVANSDFSAYQATTAKAIESKVESKDFNTYKTQTDSAITSKVESSAFQALQTQVDNSAVGANLIIQSDLKSGWLDVNGGENNSSVDFHSDNYIATNGATVFTFSSPDYVFKGSGDDRLLMYDSNKNCLGFQSLTSATQTLSKSNVAYIKFSINFTDEGGSGNLSDWLSTHRYKLEKGSVATDYSVNPEDQATQSQITQLSGDINLRVKEGDLIDQINIQTGNTLISSSDKLILSGKSILLDSVDPVVMTSANIGNLAVGTAQIANLAITDAQVGNVSATKLTAGTIDFNTITGKNINASNITTGKLSTDRLDVDKLSAVSADLGDVTAGSLKGVDIVANSFSTPNGSFTTYENGSVVASNLTIRGVTNLVYNAALLGGNGSSIPGWGIGTNGAYWPGNTHDGVPSIGYNASTGAGVWTAFAQTNLHPLNGDVYQPFSASVWFKEYGSDTSLLWQFTLAFFDSNGNRISFPNQTWNGIGSEQDWRYVTIDNVLPPSNAVSVGLQYFAYNGHGNACFSSPMLTQTAQSTGYQPDTGNVVNAGIINGSTISAGTINGSTINGSAINAGTITGSTINGATFHGGNIISDSNNTSNFYPFTIESTGKASTTFFNSMDALRTEISGGGLTTMYRAINSSGSQYEAYDGNFSGDMIALNSGFTNGKDMSFSQSVSGNQLTGQVVLSPLNGIHLWGSTQSIHFSGLQMNGTGITFNSYGNIIADQASAWWRIVDFSGNQIANFGTDTAGSNQIQFNRDLWVSNMGLGTGHQVRSKDGHGIYFTDSNSNRVDTYHNNIYYSGSVSKSLLSEKTNVTAADVNYWSNLAMSIDLATYNYKTDDYTDPLRLSGIIDDVNATKEWTLPEAFYARDEGGNIVGIDNGVLLNAVLALSQEQAKQIDQLNGHNMELEARLNKLEAKLNG